MRGSFLAMSRRLTIAGGIALGIVLVAIALVVVIYAAPGHFVSERRAALDLERAQAHLAAGEFANARSALRAALRRDPFNAEARRQLASTELRVGNWELALLEYQSLTEVHPEDAEGWIGLAGIMARSDLLEAPEAALDKGIELAAGRADAHRLRGEIRFRLGRYRGALLDAQRAVAEAPKDVASWALLARSTAGSGDTDAAIEVATRGLAATGQDASLVLLVARLLAQRGRIQEAVTMLEPIAAASGQPAASRHAQRAIAEIRLRSEDYESARKQLATTLSQHPDDEDAIALQALIDARNGSPAAALAKLDRALERLPNSRGLRVIRTRLHAANGNAAAVTTLVDEVTARDLVSPPAPPRRFRDDAQVDDGTLVALPRERWPGRLAQTRQALEAQLRQQDWAQAQRIVDAARQTYADTAFASWLAGILELARGDVDAAEKSLREALAFAPRSPIIAVGLAKVWSRKGGAALAGEQLAQLAERDRSFAFARYMAARAYVDARHPDQAEAALRRGVEAQPDSPAPYRYLADYFLGLDQAAEGIGVCRQGLERFPENSELQMMLAQISARLGRISDAAQAYDGILARRPDLDVVTYKLARLLASQEKDESLWQRAVHILAPMQADRPSDPLLLDTLGWVQFRGGDLRRARALLDAAVQGAPEEPLFRFHLASVHAKDGRVEQAREQLKIALDSKQPFAERVDALRLSREIGG